MYRDDHQATFSRAEALERQLRSERQGRREDAERLVALEAELEATRQALRNSPWPPMTRRPSDATAVLVLGALALFLFPALGPLAWYLGNRELRAIDRGVALPFDRSRVQVGRVMGMVATVVLVVGALLAISATAAAAALLQTG